MLRELNHDLEEIKNRGLVFEVIQEGEKINILFTDFPLSPNIYNIDKTDLLIFTSNQYPNAGFDMFWVDENLTLKNGSVPKQAEVIEVHLNRRWRRFRYHPYNTRPWNPSDDSVGSFIEHVIQRLRRGD